MIKLIRIVLIWICCAASAFASIQERDSNNAVLVTYTRGLDFSGGVNGAGGIGGLLARTDSSGSTFYHADGSGNVTALMDGMQNIVARYEYDPYGRMIGQWGKMAGANAMRFSSMPAFQNSGLVGYHARFYEPSFQRWLNRDPIGEAGGVNLYGFVENGPVDLFDPFGEADDSTAALIGKGVFDWMMGDHLGKPNPNMNAALLTQDLGGINPHDNLLRNAFGGGAQIATDVGREIASQYFGGKINGAIFGTLDQLEARAVGRIGVRQGAKALKRTNMPKPCPPKKPGVVYEVAGKDTPSGKPYIGRTSHPDGPSGRGNADGRNRENAKIKDAYDNTRDGKISEQKNMDSKGGIGNLDNKRNEIGDKNRKKYGLE